MRLRSWWAASAAVSVVLGLVTVPVAAAQAGTPPPKAVTPEPSALTAPDNVLPSGWRTSKDRAVAVTGDMNGLHLLVAEEAAGYQWRTAATLADNTYDADQWIGQACVTGSGERAVVVYAPRTFTNSEAAMNRGGLVAIVSLRTGVVTKVAVRASLAYFNPGCGTGETAAITAFDGRSGPAKTTIMLVDAATGNASTLPAVTGTVTSAIPVGTAAVAVQGTKLVRIESSGSMTTLSTEDGLPFRLHADRSGAVAYEIAKGGKAEVRRFAGGRSTLLGKGNLRDVRLTSVAGTVFVLGKDRKNINVSGLSGWTVLDAAVQAQPSTTGALVVTEVGRAGGAAPRFDRAEKVKILAAVTASKAAVSFQLQPSSGKYNSPPPPVLVKKDARAALTLAAGNDPTDPDAACSEPRNADTKQSYQATADQVEWAVDLAVKGQLTITRPANFRGSGAAAYKIQGTGGLFQRHTLLGGGTVPAQVLLGVLAQESNTMHASPHLVDGETGNVNQGGFYGDWSSWDTADCGYGVGQVTTGMSKAAGNTVFSPQQRQAIATDYAANIAASLNMLIDKWNQLYTLGIRAHDGDSKYVENWYLAVWAYNTGLQPNAANGNSTGCSPSPTCTDGQTPGHWGLGWLNNPANTIYPADRHRFRDGTDDDRHPNLWPYPEKVMGWAYSPVVRWDYVDGGWESAYYRVSSPNSNAYVPSAGTFCVALVNQCIPGGTTDVWGTPGAGLCTLSDLHCWWHSSVNWRQASTCSLCGREYIAFAAGTPEPARPDVYPPGCGLTGLPSNALIVDDTDVPDSVAPCAKGPDGGDFGWTFAQQPPDMNCVSNCITYQSKIDFHQIGGSGYGGHFWFTHTVAPTEQYLKVTGTWTLNPTNKWTRLFVHIPAVGAMTHQARYVINLPNGQQKFRVIPTSYEANTWVDIGVYDMTGGTASPTVSLSNVTNDGGNGGYGNNDIAWDALAYVALPAKPANFVVALGDSYSSGEGNGDYYHVSDQYGDIPELRNACRRSPHAWPRQVKLPGQTKTVGQLADERDASMSFAFAACSGARTWNLASEQESWPLYNGEPPHGQYGELPQLDQGLLDSNTTLVLLTVGGNDAGFTSVATACGMGPCPSESDLQNKILQEVKPRVAKVVQEIRTRAPNAFIVLAGYPVLFNDDAALDQCSQNTPVCSLVHQYQLSVSHDECMMLNRIGRFMDANLQQSDPAQGILRVSVMGTFYGHAISGWASSDYLNTATTPRIAGDSGEESAHLPDQNLVGMGSFHPTTAGSAYGFAAAVTNALIGR